MADGPPSLLLPPNFEARRLSAAEIASQPPLEYARAHARELGAGALVWSEGQGCMSVAVVFEPDQPLGEARWAFYAGMAALAQAVTACAAPERAVTIGWPDTLLYDGARLGGGTLLWPEGAAETSVPDWLVFGGDLIATRPDLPAPGAFPDSISLAEEEIGPLPRLIESFACNLLRNVDTWTAVGRDAFAPHYLGRLVPASDLSHAITPEGDLLERTAANVTVRRDLLPALGRREWYDPARAGPRW